MGDEVFGECLSSLITKRCLVDGAIHHPLMPEVCGFKHENGKENCVDDFLGLLQEFYLCYAIRNKKEAQHPERQCAVNVGNVIECESCWNNRESQEYKKEKEELFSLDSE